MWELCWSLYSDFVTLAKNRLEFFSKFCCVTNPDKQQLAVPLNLPSRYEIGFLWSNLKLHQTTSVVLKILTSHVPVSRSLVYLVWSQIVMKKKNPHRFWNRHQNIFIYVLQVQRMHLMLLAGTTGRPIGWSRCNCLLKSGFIGKFEAIDLRIFSDVLITVTSSLHHLQIGMYQIRIDLSFNCVPHVIPYFLCIRHQTPLQEGNYALKLHLCD